MTKPIRATDLDVEAYLRQAGLQKLREYAEGWEQLGGMLYVSGDHERAELAAAMHDWTIDILDRAEARTPR